MSISSCRCCTGSFGVLELDKLKGADCRFLIDRNESMRQPIIIGARAAFLEIRVFWEAFWLAPKPFLTAAKWWLLGKRVRARGQFAPLLGQTSRAYEWWSVQEALCVRDPSPPGVPPIVALVGHAADRSAMETTLASLAAEHVEAFVIGPGVSEDLARAAVSIDWSASPWLLPISAGDSLAPGAVHAYRTKIESGAGVNVFFADDDIRRTGGHRTSPHFKPDWNEELFRHHDYLTEACVVRINRKDLEKVSGEIDWAKGLIMRALAQGGTPAHIRQVLHHRRRRRLPSRLLPHLKIAANLPRVSVIVPTRNRLDLLTTSVAGLEATAYPDLEIIVVDNDSDDPSTLEFLSTLASRSSSGLSMRVLRHPGPFNYSAINNRAVAEANGELICLLNNDVEILAPDWLAMMATQAQRKEVGAVGAQLLYSDGRLQHAGVVIGVGNAAGHAHRFLRPEEEGYFRRHALPQFVTAVTAACLVVDRNRFLAVGGLDESAFPVAFNDVDLCLRLNARGWQSFYEPRAMLVHHESVSRGFDRDPVGAARFAGELTALQQRWRTTEVFDPYHHPQLSRASEQFTMALWHG